MIVFCVTYTHLENMLKLFLLNLTVIISQSAPAHQPRNYHCHLIFMIYLFTLHCQVFI